MITALLLLLAAKPLTKMMLFGFVTLMALTLIIGFGPSIGIISVTALGVMILYLRSSNRQQSHP